MRLRHALAIVVVAVAGTVTSAQAAFTGITFFGDELSDTGNVLTLTTLFAPPPFPNFPEAPGRFSDGPVWAEHLAGALGFPGAAAPSNLIYNGSSVVPIGISGGQNFSFGGARTGLGGSAGATTGLLGQLIAWNGAPFNGPLTRVADPNALYVVAAGVNDVRDARSNPGANSPFASAINVVNVLALLAQAGAEHFLVANVPDLGLTPEASALGLIAQSTATSLAFNAALTAGLEVLDATFAGSTGIDLDIRLLDLFGLTSNVHDDALNNGGAAFGITNITAPCIAPVQPGAYFFPGSTDINCSVSAYADQTNFSSAMHDLTGELATGPAPAIPEPHAIVLVLTGLALVALRKRALRRASVVALFGKI